MRIDLPACKFKNCKYNFDHNCKSQARYDCCDFAADLSEVKLLTIKKFKEELFKQLKVCGTSISVEELNNAIKSAEAILCSDELVHDVQARLF